MPQELTDKVPLDDIDLDDTGADTTDATAAAAAAATDDTADAGTNDGEDTGAGDDGAGATDDSGDTSADAGDAGQGATAEGESTADANSGEMVPKNRFDEVNSRRKAAEAEAAQLRQILTNVSATRANDGRTDAATTTTETTAAAPRDFDKEFNELQDKYDRGEIEEAELRKEERKLIREQAKAEAIAELEPTLKELQQERQNARIEKIRSELTAEAAKVYEKYPFLNVESDAANKEAIDAVMAERDVLIKAGIAPAKALRMAVNEVAPQYGQAVAPAATTAAASTDEVAARRTAAARKAAGRAEAAQPPTLNGTGNGARTQAAPQLSASVKDHEKWASIPEAERERTLSA